MPHYPFPTCMAEQQILSFYPQVALLSHPRIVWEEAVHAVSCVAIVCIIGVHWNASLPLPHLHGRIADFKLLSANCTIITSRNRLGRSRACRKLYCNRLHYRCALKCVITPPPLAWQNSRFWAFIRKLHYYHIQESFGRKLCCNRLHYRCGLKCLITPSQIAWQNSRF